MRFIILFILAFIINTNIFSQTIGPKIPWAQVQADWTFPIYFEDALGKRDTFYIIVDSTARIDIVSDSILGYYSFGNIDTLTGFETFVHFNGYSQKYYKCSTNNYSGDFGASTEISASNYTYPIKMSWDTTLFNIQNMYLKEIKFAGLQNGYYCCDDIYFNMKTSNELFLTNSFNGFPITITILDYNLLGIDNKGITTLTYTKKNDKYYFSEPVNIDIIDINGRIIIRNENVMLFDKMCMNHFAEIYIIKVTPKNRINTKPTLFYEKN
jgi:hypothetical protein